MDRKHIGEVRPDVGGRTLYLCCYYWRASASASGCGGAGMANMDDVHVIFLFSVVSTKHVIWLCAIVW